VIRVIDLHHMNYFMNYFRLRLYYFGGLRGSIHQHYLTLFVRTGAYCLYSMLQTFMARSRET
jgi:hypothetical protein